MQMRFMVTDADTAAALGSGDVPVLGTPRLIAWTEAATVRAAAPLLTPGQTSVGTAVRIQHQRPTRVGEAVEVSADLRGAPAGKHLTFAVRVMNSSGELVADGQIDRVIVDREQFLARRP
jgi:predicted thioesterase